jgi:hypothetical protein
MGGGRRVEWDYFTNKLRTHKKRFLCCKKRDTRWDYKLNVIEHEKDDTHFPMPLKFFVLEI